MKPEHRARAMELAASRGEKGFSSIVGDAMDLYLAEIDKRSKPIRAALALEGCLSEEEAVSLSKKTKAIRNHWR